MKKDRNKVNGQIQIIILKSKSDYNIKGNVKSFTMGNIIMGENVDSGK